MPPGRAPCITEPIAESLVPDGGTKRSGSLQNDLEQLAGLVSTDVPAYYLVRLDSSASEWLAISYVPDTAKVRDKVRGAPISQPS